MPSSIQNGLKQEDALSPLFFNFTSEYAIRRVEENQRELKLNGTRQLLVYADDVNLLDDNTDTTKRNTQTLIDASKEVGQGRAIAQAVSRRLPTAAARVQSRV
jgi:poly(3-hydroxyalkanoate) synthetase